MSSAEVKLYGTTIGTVAWDAQRELGVFQYAPAFITSGIEVSPLHMPLSGAPLSFPDLSQESFQGLPGMLADCLPDDFGKRMTDLWFASRGHPLSGVNPVEKLCFMADRGMGALEFEPALLPKGPNRAMRGSDLRGWIDALLNEVSEEPTGEQLEDVIRLSSIVGGRRAKAAIAFSPRTGNLRTSLGTLDEGFEPWLIKFDGVASSLNKNTDDPLGHSKIKIAYYHMALEAGITMSRSQLLEEQGRAYFMTRRFDRSPYGRRIHMQSLAALGHLDFRHGGGSSYEQAFQICRKMGLGYPELEELYRRAIFNILARNQNDHAKNTTLLMDRRGQWSLAPAYDLTFTYQPNGLLKSEHQMTLNGKRDDFEMNDLLSAAKKANVKPRRAISIINEVKSALNNCSKHGYASGVTQGFSVGIAQQFRQIR
ncbi:type II toxin-antitoxin system HipA family toxin [Akkermansiaceae bacterium]|nr:type II toxin-antitoxin system HipA family toxin [Akkermansiaceae bacterium]MDA8875959.1 type II toxin-antitoxin system HipA family toxin [Akkermansiaceae bacterium]MDA8967135.1 type II toxin-antitoxin system HipA family toxin [Akkermansiaceae bacterium]MDB4505215.1 type II toxin-antitoxin system HipA family toxin [Akkermansiaceae bacterium]